MSADCLHCNDACEAVQGFCRTRNICFAIYMIHANSHEEAVEVGWERRLAVHDGGNIDDPCGSGRAQQRPQLLRQREGPQHVYLQGQIMQPQRV